MARVSPLEENFRESGMPSDICRVVNPTDEPFIFTYKNDANINLIYQINGGETKRWPRYMSAHYAMHMLDKMLNRAGAMTHDSSEREKLFKKLVVEVIQTDMQPTGIASPDGEGRINDDTVSPAADRDFAKEAVSSQALEESEATEDAVPNEPVEEPEKPPEKPLAPQKQRAKRQAGTAVKDK